MDMNGQVIPGLYCAGESAGGFNQHGMGRCATQGYIAGINAAIEARMSSSVKDVSRGVSP